MKIKKQHLLIAVSVSFVLFSGGFFLGRSLTRPAVVTGHRAPMVQTALPPEIVPSEPAFPLNVNAASAGELDHLPGIGEAIARRIVEYREANGPFQGVSELLNVEGIGPAKLEEILPYIETGG